MKTKKAFWHAAIAAIAICSFSACASSEEDELQNSENERGVVKTEFTISFPQQMGARTRQSEAIVQGQTTPVFRGLQKIELRPFSIKAENVSSNTNIPGSINLGTSTGDAGYTLASNASSIVTLKPTGTNQVSKSQLYKDIEVPIGTRSFMFYGVAKDNETSTGSHNIVNGALEKKETGTTLNDISISPVQIYGNNDTHNNDTHNDDTHNEAATIAKYLTNIAKASATIDGEEKNTLYFFPNFTKITTGSWNSVKAAVRELYKSVYSTANYDTNGNATNLPGAIVKAILKQGETTFATEGTDGTLNFTVDYTYPRNIGLPDGAAYVEWNSEAFVVKTKDNINLSIASLDKYVYPASLYYYGLSNIKTVGSPMNSYYNSDRTWAEIIKEYNNQSDKSDVVQSTTRSIAIENEVQYAVGRLDVTVQATNGLSTLKDANNQDVSLGANTFPITGIIVGNQRVVDYKFEAKEKSKTGNQYTIYDSQVTENTPYLYNGSNVPAATHTLVLETVDVNEDQEKATTETTEGKITYYKAPNADVPIAVEFENKSGKTFVGRNKELIYPDTKFYLIGKLYPDKNKTEHYDNDESKPLIKKAFVKDYITTANFKVSSLQNAYNMLPDLRTPHLEIGLSVDLNWKTGITQDISIE